MLKETACDIAKRASVANPGYSFDPTIIYVIIEIVEMVLPMIIELCDKESRDVPELAKDTLAYGGFKYRWTRRQARRAVGWRDYYGAGGDRVLDAVLGEAAESDPEDIGRLYAEITS